MDIFQTLVGGLIGGGLIGFIEFLIRRRDERNDRSADILRRLDGIDRRIKELDEKGDEREAVNSRIRILRFMDELRSGRLHSKDSYDQCMTDITDYEHYCNTHKDFKNNQTELTIEHIRHNYAERLEKNDFL